MTNVELFFESEWNRYITSQGGLINLDPNKLDLNKLIPDSAFTKGFQLNLDIFPSEEIYKGISKLDENSLRFFSALLCLCRPKSEEEIQEIGLVVLKKFGKIAATEEEANLIWQKYRPTFLRNYKQMTEGIMAIGYERHGFEAVTYKIDDHLTIPFNHESFIEKYREIDPIGYPVIFTEYKSALKKINKSINQEDEGKPTHERKGYDNYARVRAFYIYQMYLEGIITEEDMASKRRIMEISAREFPSSSAKTAYQALKGGKYSIYHNKNKTNEIENERELYPNDYTYALKLYKAKYPDS
jgi:hypothetical protein